MLRGIAMADNDPRLQKLVEAFVQDITRVAHDAAHDVLRRALGAAGVVAPTATAPLAKRPAPSRAKRPASGAGRPGTRRAPSAIDASKTLLLAAIIRTPGQRFEEIRAELGGDRASLQLPLRKLVAEGAVKSKGVKRATRYYPAAAGR